MDSEPKNYARTANPSSIKSHNAINLVLIITIYYNLLQFITIYYNLLQFITIYYNLLQFITIYYNLLQFITIYYNSLQFSPLSTCCFRSGQFFNF